MKIAIMQPYFIPYAGYFRLISRTDLFVIYDCVQFPRRSWVHRNQLYDTSGKLNWLTLPLHKQPMTTAIKDLSFHEDAVSLWKNNINKFPQFNQLKTQIPTLYDAITELHHYPVTYLASCLKEICRILSLPFNVCYSSTLKISENLKGKDRILAICKHFNATDYINVPGGRELYNERDFLEKDINLHFLPTYEHEYRSIVQCLIDQNIEDVKSKVK